MTSFPRETFGTRMRRYREYRKFSQVQCAREARVSQASISKYEHDQLVPDVYAAIRLSALLRFPLKGLVKHP